MPRRQGRFSAFTIGFAILMGLYQAVTIRTMGIRSMALAFLVLPEMAFNIVRHWWLGSSLVLSFVSRRRSWS